MSAIEWSDFLCPLFVCFSLFAFKLGATSKLCLYTRPEIKSWPDVKFCAHAQCVLPRCSCPQTPWSFPSLPSSSLLSTIFCSRPKFLDELARKRLLRRLKFRTSKFRPSIAFTISTNKLHLAKNGREGLKLGCFTFTRTTRVEIFCTNIKL